MSLSISATYAGEVLEAFLTHAVVGNDTVDKGCINVKSGIQYKYTIPRVKVSSIIQSQAATPSSSKGTFTVDERQLVPQDFMVYTEFNPRDMESFWKFAQPEGNLVFRTLDPTVQVQLVGELLKEVNRYMGQAIWHGKKSVAGTIAGTPTGGVALGDAASDLDQFDGLMARILEDELAAVAGDTPIRVGTDAEIDDTTKILAAMNAVYEGIPKSLYGSADLKIMLDWDLFNLYDKALIESNFKHADYTGTNVQRFRGIPVVPTNGAPAHTIVACEASASRMSNLWMGVDFQNDENVVQVEKKQANSELYFFKMLMKADTKVAKPAELVYHTTYTIV